MRLSVPVNRLEVVPGQPVSLAFEVVNTDDVIIGVDVRVLGLDPDWVDVQPASLSLFPASAAMVTLVVTVPLDFPAGERRVALQATSQADPSRFAITEIELVAPVQERVRLAVEPESQTVGGKATYAVVVENTGNAPLRLGFEAIDPELKVTTEFSPPHLEVPPGERADTRAVVRGPRPWFGTAAARVVTFRALGTTEPLEALGVMIQRPRLSRGSLSLIGLALAVTVFAVVLTSSLRDVVDVARVDERLLLQAIDGDRDRAGVPANPATIIGTVTSLSSGEPVPGVTVQLYDAGDPNVALTTAATGDDGSYRFPTLAEGDYKLRFLGAGFTEVWFRAASTFEDATTVSAAEGATVGGIDVSLGGRPGSVSGTVLGIDPSGATVTLVVPALELGSDSDAVVTSAIVDPTGAFQLTGVPTPRAYQLVVSKPGFATERRDVVLAAAEERAGIEIVLRQGDGSIAGRVLDANGPLGGVTITATDGVSSSSTISLTTGDEVGAFTVRDLATPATYTLTFAAEGYVTQTLTVNLGLAENRESVVVVLAGGTGFIQGEVSIVDDGPAGGVTVTASDGEFTRSTVTLSQGSVGSYLLRGLPTPGTYTVTFSRPGLASLTTSVVLDPTAGTGARGVDATLSRATGNIAGTVQGLDTNGVAQPVGGAQVVLTDGALTRTTVSANTPPGAFRFDDLPPGAYTLTFTRDGSTPRTVLATVTAGTDTAVDVVLERRASITGRVLQVIPPPEDAPPDTPPELVPLAGAGVRIYRLVDFPGAVLVETTTGADGTYEFPSLNAPETYIIEVSVPPGSPGLASRNVVIAAGQQLTGIDIEVDLQ